MKLGRGEGAVTGCALLAVSLLLAGCASTTSAAHERRDTTVRLMAADLTVTADPPKVGKSQRSARELRVDKDGSRRPGDRRTGGGFSGYK